MARYVQPDKSGCAEAVGRHLDRSGAGERGMALRSWLAGFSEAAPASYIKRSLAPRKLALNISPPPPPNAEKSLKPKQMLRVQDQGLVLFRRRKDAT